MNKEELYNLALSDIHEYNLLNEIFAIRDTRVETVDYTIGVNGFISLDVLNQYVNRIKENQQLKEQLKRKYDNFPKTVKNLSKEELESLYLDLLHVENEKSQQLKQKDETLDKASSLIVEYLCTMEYCSLNAPLLANLFLELRQILRK